MLLHESTDDLNRFVDEPAVEPIVSDSDISDDEDEDLDTAPIVVSNRSVRSTLTREIPAIVVSRKTNGIRPIRYTDVEISDDD